MALTSHLPEFLEYLAENQELKPSRTFDARAAEASELPRGLFASFPPGDVFVYPDFLVFLTTRKFREGVAVYGEDVAHRLAEHVQGAMMLHKWMLHPASALLDIAKILKAQNKQIVSTALSNPYSFFIPLFSVTQVATGGGYVNGFKEGRGLAIQPLYISITTDETSYMLYQNTDISFWNITNIKRAHSTITSKWQTDVVQLLEARSKQTHSGHISVQGIFDKRR